MIFKPNMSPAWYCIAMIGHRNRSCVASRVCVFSHRCVSSQLKKACCMCTYTASCGPTPHRKSRNSNLCTRNQTNNAINYFNSHSRKRCVITNPIICCLDCLRGGEIQGGAAQLAIGAGWRSWYSAAIRREAAAGQWALGCR